MFVPDFSKKPPALVHLFSIYFLKVTVVVQSNLLSTRVILSFATISGDIPYFGDLAVINATKVDRGSEILAFTSFL